VTESNRARPPRETNGARPSRETIPDRVRDALLALPAPRCAYVYDRATLQATAAAVRAALPKASSLLYAVKANGHPDVLAALAAEVDGFEVGSGGELALARIARAGLGGATEIVFGGPAKTEAELEAAVEADAVVNVESALELRRLAVAAETAGMRVRVSLRVNRDHVALAGTHRMTGTATPFGIGEDQLATVVHLAAGHPSLRLNGFALHAVSNNLDAAAHAAFVVDAVAWSVRAAHAHGLALETINVGGGLGIDYAGSSRFDLDVLADGLAEVARVLPEGVRLVFELGRFLTAEAGWYAAEVVDLKRNHGRWFAVLRGGTHHFRLPAAWGYSHPFTVLPVPGWARPYDRPEISGVTVDAVGELCTPRDVLAREQPVDRLRVGDLLVFGRAGAYGWEVSHHDFLHHDPPEFLVTG
jgi:diaminopimelate decarboxylase